MSFGGGGFSFGQNNNTSAFGNSNTTNTGFGASTFGSNNTTTNAFGGGGTGFGSSTGAFGSTNNNASTSLFGGNKTTPGFGSSTNTGGSLFGNTANTNTGFGTSTTGGAFGSTNTTSSPFGGGSSNAFGGFGANNNNNNNTTTTTSAFGSTASKPLFGAGGAGTTGGFGSTGSAFGSGNPAGPLQPCQGTGGVPFSPVEEKETNGVISKYQTISTMEPYQKYSLEELRLADYAAGRQFGNGTGTAGAFGQTNFGGFGNNTNTAGGFGSNTGTSGGLFGSTTTSAGGFGSNTATTGGFGTSNNNNSGGLFGNKTGGSLFGNSNTTTNTGGNLFGNNNTTSTGFGANNNAQAGGIFGNNNQNKPGGLFGTNTSTTTGGGLFGNNNNQQTTAATSGGLFGTSNNTGGGLFGNNNQQQNAAGGFGNTNNNQQSGGLFGNKTGTGFGTNTTQTSSTGGLFGSANNNNSGSLFGNNNATTNNTGSSLFGGNNNNNQQQSGGLFGSNQNKAGGLFGNNNTNTGGSLFGNNNTTQQSGGTFGANNQQQQSNTGGGLFGNNNNQSTGNSLFGNQTQNKPSLFGTTSTGNQGGGLFGTSNTGGGGFGNSMNQSQQNPNQSEVKHASLLDSNPYGQSSIWTGLPTPNEQNSKPLFTPLTATKKMQESAMKPIQTLRLNQSRYMTPPRRGGYGLSYSTYGTPSSVASTPGAGPLSGSLYASRGWSGGGSFGRSFNRSSSVQNLRTLYGNDSDDIWKPNAFAPSHRNSSGSIKRLTIDKSIRTDLFNRPIPVPALPAPKSVSNGDAGSNPQPQAAEPSPDPTRKLSKRVSWSDNAAQPSLDAESGALVRTEDSDEEPPQPSRNGASTNLQAVPEDHESHQVSSQTKNTKDNTPGKYWMKPSRQEMSRMPRNELKSFKGFQVGREGCGHVTFDFPVDLTKVDLDNLFGGLIDITVRAITVYPDKATKPPVGQGLNVPSTLAISNSWPRSKGQPVADKSGPLFDKHIKRLKRVPNTNFIKYDTETGIWTFTVDHYTRYGLDYDEESEMDQSELSLPPQSIAKSADASVMEVDDHTDSDFQDDDTFDFKRLPGQFGNRSGIPIDSDSGSAGDEVEMSGGSEHTEQSEPEYMSEEASSPLMPGALPSNDQFLFSPIKAPIKSLVVPGTPGKTLLDLEGDWAEQLQRTISPRKQNRDVLRQAQSKIALDQAFSPIKPKPAPQVNFKSSVDIMNAIFPTSNRKTTQAVEADFEFPYSKRPKTFHDDQPMDENDRSWHNSFKPHFGNDGKLLYRAGKAHPDAQWQEKVYTSGTKDAVVAGQEKHSKPFDLDAALSFSEIKVKDSLPTVKHHPTQFSTQAARIEDKHVKLIYEVSHVLFDTYEDEFTHGLSGPLQKKFMHRIRRDRLASFLAQLIKERLTDSIEVNPLRRAVLHLTAHDLNGAIDMLKKGHNYRLALLVSQLDSADQVFMDDMKHQLDAWRAQKSLSEFDLDVRALYEICAGNVSICEGREGRGVPVEDRAETFNLSTRYNLDWLQCFALGFFYGRNEKANKDGVAKIEDAVKEYQGRCDRGEEPVKPSSDDVVWSLLKLYSTDKIDMELLEFPAALDGLASTWSHSDLFVYFNTLQANLKVHVDTEKADELADSLAAEQSGQGDIASAIYALIHLSSPATRKTQIQNLLDWFGAQLPGSDSVTSDATIQLWQRLTIDLKVPHAWIYMAKARYAASTTNNGGDNISELRYLVAAESWADAHECLLQRVAPALVIDQDWQGIVDMCRLFGDNPPDHIAGWHDGGDVYSTFAHLMSGSIAKTDTDKISNLRRRLVKLGEHHNSSRIELGRLSRHELEEYVAIREMANGLARLRDQGANVGTAAELLELPLTADVRGEIELFEAVKTGPPKTASRRRPARGRDTEMRDVAQPTA